MTSTRRSCLRALIALVLVALTIPGEAMRPDPAAVAAAALRPTDTVDATPPAAPGTYRSASSAASVPITAIDIALPAGTTTNDVLLAIWSDGRRV